MKYRKKSVVIEAIQWLPDTPSPAPDWYIEALEKEIIQVYDQFLRIQTMEETMTANPGDWIIKGVKGEIYPCKPNIFEATYEPAE
ncbi:MAG TPA: hypothetical protein VGA05_08550 [Candidatus Bathyarchaeia archaeon]